MAIKKSELYSSLWKSCDELRGGMDASQYKDYVLVLLFVKYVSDKYAGKTNSVIEVPPGGSFTDMIALKGDKDIGDKMNKIIATLAEANELRGVIDVADFNDPDKLGKGKEMQDRLSNLISIFQNPGLNFSKNRAGGDDLLGDAYEYLMRHFATQSGKSKGQFYTPTEVSRIMAKVIGVNASTSQSQTVYDPTCGSGSLLLRAADEAPFRLTIYGQEMDNATVALAKMNMILHNHPTAEIWHDNTLSSPQSLNTDGTLKTFDFAVANPPFSSKAWSNGFDPFNDQYKRFTEGVPPAKNGDYAFLLHLVHSLKSTGKGAIILPHGVLFRGNAEAEIRRNLIKRGYIKGIIGLPANLFYGTSIPACIIVIDKEQSAVAAANRTGIFMIDASRGFVKDGNKNRLRDQDIHKIVDVFNKRLAVDKYSRLVSLDEIEANGYNLNIPRYIDSSEPEDLQDIEAHLLGGIPNHDIESLSGYWQVFPTLKSRLFTPGTRPGYSEVKVKGEDEGTAKIKPVIFEHPEFAAFVGEVGKLLTRWRENNFESFTGLNPQSAPKELIADLSEDLLRVFTGISLIDKYDIYQRLMTYWSETMEDDVYLIVADGWKASPELIPPSLIADIYFASEQKHLESLEAGRDDITRKMEELLEEHGGEDGLLEEAKNEKGKITKVSLNARLKNIFGESEEGEKEGEGEGEGEGDGEGSGEERKLLMQYLYLLESEVTTNRKLKEAQQALKAKVNARYSQLGEDEVKKLVVENKWLATLTADIQSEPTRLTQALTRRIQELTERYATPLPQLCAEVETLFAKVEAHLRRMGFVWN
jgi:type I restriction enzyme M protein